MSIMRNFHQSIQKTQKFALFYWAAFDQSIDVSAKNVQRRCFRQHSILMQNFKEKWLVLSKMTWGIWQIFTKARLKVEKFGLLLGSFIQNRKCMSSKFTWDLCVITMKNDVKFHYKLMGQFKTDMRNLTILDSSTQKSQ